MRVLITGAQGQVGKEIVTAAKKNNLQAIVAGRAELDITQAMHIEKFFQMNTPDIVVNAAAYTAVDLAEDNATQADAINHIGAKNLASICAQANIPLLHLSTDYIFNGASSEPYQEQDDISPLGVYGESKWQGEQSIRKHLERHIILRVAWVFGAQGNNFVKTMLRLGKERDKLNIVSDQFGGPTPAKAIAQTLVHFIKQYNNNKTLPWGTYHYCGNKKTSWYEFAKEIFSQAQQLKLLSQEIELNPIPTEQYPTPAARPKNSMLNCSKIKKTFDIDMPDWRYDLKQVMLELATHRN